MSEDDLWSVPAVGGLARRLTRHCQVVCWSGFLGQSWAGWGGCGGVGQAVAGASPVTWFQVAKRAVISCR
jgi:hypothetical protein